MVPSRNILQESTWIIAAAQVLSCLKYLLEKSRFNPFSWTKQRAYWWKTAISTHTKIEVTWTFINPVNKGNVLLRLRRSSQHSQIRINSISVLGKLDVPRVQLTFTANNYLSFTFKRSRSFQTSKYFCCLFLLASR